jgi:thiamine-phosphate pyrophosphorylase
MPLPRPPLLVISDRNQTRQPLLAVAAAAFAGGCRWFSLREKDLPAAERRRLLEQLVAIGRRCGAVVTAHEDIDAVVATGAAGVHLPGGAEPAAARSLQPLALIGASAHSVAEAEALLHLGADYVTLSPIFATASKPGYGPALGLARLAEAGASGPIVALGGITARNAAACLRAGAQGIAVMGEVMRASDPELTVRKIVRAIDEAGDGFP